MACCTSPYQSALERVRVIRWWSAAQWVLLGVSVLLLAALVFWPTVGLHAFWDVLIPAAPALVVLAPGVWRNICPLGTMSQLARKFGRTRAHLLSVESHPRLGLLGVALLLVLVPLRHPLFNQSGVATAILLLSAGVVAVAMGVWLGGKSGWCAGLCPVHAVERLYGLRPAVTVTSAHCTQCVKCVTPCPDTTPGQRHGLGVASPARSVTTIIMIGGFPGYVWGWFHVPDGISTAAAATWIWPFGGMIVTAAAYVFITRVITRRASATTHRRAAAIFGAAAVSCYYWFRLPALIGFGPFPGDGMLVDGRGVISPLAIAALQGVVTLFFFWWMVFRRPAPKPWMYRPEAAPQPSVVTIGVS